VKRREEKRREEKRKEKSAKPDWRIKQFFITSQDLKKAFLLFSILLLFPLLSTVCT